MMMMMVMMLAVLFVIFSAVLLKFLVILLAVLHHLFIVFLVMLVVTGWHKPAVVITMMTVAESICRHIIISESVACNDEMNFTVSVNAKESVVASNKY